MNNKELYKNCFSRLHTSTNLDVDNMESIRRKVVCKKIMTLCMVALVCVLGTIGGTYAVTGGETANPFEAFDIFINGEDAKDSMIKGEDGNYSIKLGADDEFILENETTKIQVKVPENPAKSNVTLKLNQADNISVEVGE